MTGPAKFVLAALIVVAVAQFAPEAVNAFLLLLLIGIIVMRYPAFQSLISQASNLGK